MTDNKHPFMPVFPKREYKGRAMISQPMKGLDTEKILAVRKEATRHLESMGYEVINTFFEESYVKQSVKDVKTIPVFFLAHALDAMSKADLVYFCKGWENSRKCAIVHDVAVAYNIDIFHE